MKIDALFDGDAARTSTVVNVARRVVRISDVLKAQKEKDRP